MARNPSEHPMTPAQQAFNRSAAELTAALAEAKRKYLENQLFLERMRYRPLTRPEARLEP